MLSNTNTNNIIKFVYPAHGVQELQTACYQSRGGTKGEMFHWWFAPKKKINP